MTTTTIIKDYWLRKDGMLSRCHDNKTLYYAWCKEIAKALKDTPFKHQPETGELLGLADGKYSEEDMKKLLDSTHENACEAYGIAESRAHDKARRYLDFYDDEDAELVLAELKKIYNSHAKSE